jgi:hypothetical protein
MYVSCAALREEHGFARHMFTRDMTADDDAVDLGGAARSAGS